MDGLGWRTQRARLLARLGRREAAEEGAFVDLCWAVGVTRMSERVSPCLFLFLPRSPMRPNHTQSHTPQHHNTNSVPVPPGGATGQLPLPRRAAGMRAGLSGGGGGGVDSG